MWHEHCLQTLLRKDGVFSAESLLDLRILSPFPVAFLMHQNYHK